ncbi:hypothetical protein BGX38DRAFT_1271470 [Terfezia claveryi]|nr:hypothetical protein BGX38DRAFT_1271470 [Terfezia claveryi]
MLSTKNLPARYHSSKLSPKWIGPFTITKYSPWSQNAKLNFTDFPDLNNINNSFHTSLLKPFFPNPIQLFPSRTLEQPGPVKEDRYEVERVLEFRSQPRTGKLQYKLTGSKQATYKKRKVGENKLGKNKTRKETLQMIDDERKKVLATPVSSNAVKIDKGKGKEVDLPQLMLRHFFKERQPQENTDTYLEQSGEQSGGGLTYEGEGSYGGIPEYDQDLDEDFQLDKVEEPGNDSDAEPIPKTTATPPANGHPYTTDVTRRLPDRYQAGQPVRDYPFVNQYSAQFNYLYLFLNAQDYMLAWIFTLSKVPKMRINNFFQDNILMSSPADSPTSRVAFKSGYTLWKQMDKMIADYEWSTGSVQYALRPKSDFYYHNIVDCIKYLLRQRTFVTHVVWEPVKLFNVNNE